VGRARCCDVRRAAVQRIQTHRGSDADAAAGSRPGDLRSVCRGRFNRRYGDFDRPRSGTGRKSKSDVSNYAGSHCTAIHTYRNANGARRSDIAINLLAYSGQRAGGSDTDAADFPGGITQRPLNARRLAAA
jgi:hypothetical protein